MKDESISEALGELKRNLTLLFVLNKLIDSILVFLILLVVGTMLRLSPVYPLAISLVYFVYSVIKQVSVNKIKVVEKEYKNMNEKLRTASEYASSDSRIVRELHSEVLRELKGVKQSSFFSKKNYLKAAFIVVLSGLVSLSTSVDIDFEEILPFELGDQISIPIHGEANEEDASIHLLTLADQGTAIKELSRSLYGKPSVAKLGDEELKIRIGPAGTELDAGTVGEPELPDFSEEYPKEISSVSASNYEESLSKDDLDIVRDYFNKISEDSRSKDS